MNAAPSTSTLAAPARGAPAHCRFADAATRVAGAVFPFLVVGALWEIVAHLGVFPERLFPTLETVAAAFATLFKRSTFPLS